MPIYLKTSVATNSWRKTASLYLKTSAATNSWRKIVSAYIKTNDGWRSLFSSIIIPSIQTRVEVSSSGGINAGSTIMNDASPITLTSKRYHWLNADGFTYIWQKSANNATWTNIGTEQSTTNPAFNSSSSSITRTLSASDFTSGSDMYFRFVFYATNSTSGTSNSSESLPILISYYGTPVPQPGSPSITGSTVVGNTASANIGTWTNSPTSYDYNVFYTSGLSTYPLTYAGVKSVSNKFLSGFSASLVTSASHGYKANDTVVVSGMDSLFNGSHTITLKTNNTIFFTLPTPTAWSASTAYSVGSLVSYLGDAYYAAITMPAPTLYSVSSAYNIGDNAWDGFTRYRCIQALPSALSWSISSGYSVGNHVFNGTIRYICAQSISAVSQWSSSTNYTSGSIVHFNGTRWRSEVQSGPGYIQGPQSPSSSNPVYWSEVDVSLSNSFYWTQINASLSGTSYWQNAYPYNSSYWTLQSFSNTSTSGTTTAPNYYEGTVSSSTSIPVPITTFDYKQGIDLRGATTSGSGVVLSFGVKAYNQATLSPSEYLGQAFIYGVPILSTGSITPVYTTASVPFTSSYISSYLLNLYTQPSITNVIGGATTVTYFAQNTFTSGQQVTITGVNPPVYNGVRTIQSANATSFTVSANITDTYVSGGTAKVTVSGYPLTVSSNTSPRSITGLSQGTTYYLEMTPSNNGMTGTMQTSSFTTLIQPTISNISVFNSTLFPSSATSISVSNTPPSNTGSVSWINGANTSVANLRSVTGSGSLSTQPDPTLLLTSGSFSVISTGTANATIRAINTNKEASVTWSQTNAQSHRILYTISGVPGTQEKLGNSSLSNPSVVLGGGANTYTITNITVYPNIDQGGTGVTLSSTASGAGADRITDTAGSGSVTFTSPTWTITWNANGGTGGGTTTQNQGVSHTAPSPGTRSGFNFVYWRNPASGDILYIVNDGGTFNPTSNITFTAVWSVITYTVTYNANGGTVSPTSATVNAGSSVTLPSPSRSGFTFNGWYTASSGGSFLGFAGTSYTPSSSITIFAQWTAIQYTVTWNANGGTGGGTTTQNAGIAHTAPSPGTRSGFTFTGYNDTPSGDFLYGPIASGGSFTPPSSITMYARWAAIVPNVTQITALGLGNTSAPYIRFTFTSTNAASLSIMLYRSATSSTGPWTPLAARSVQSTTGTFSIDFSSRTGTTSNWYYVDVIPYSGSGGTGTAGTTRTSRVKRGTETTTTTVYP
jgi:uncharacterized repeat protein (TIGR02543 family)